MEQILTHKQIVERIEGLTYDVACKWARRGHPAWMANCKRWSVPLWELWVKGQLPWIEKNLYPVLKSKNKDKSQKINEKVLEVIQGGNVQPKRNYV